MKLHLQPDHDVSESRPHTLRWSTLGDAMIEVTVSSKERRTDCDLLDYITFSEVQLLRGTEILIPNHYKGYFCGPAIIGVNPIGAFFLLCEESLSENRLENTFLLGSNDSRQSNTSTDLPIVRQEGMQFSGLLTIDPAKFDFTLPMHPPNPVSVRLQLELTEEISQVQLKAQLDYCQTPIEPCKKAFIGSITFTDNGQAHKMKAGICFGVAGHQGDVLILCTSHILSTTSSQSIVFSSFDRFLQQSQIYGWFQGDCIVSLAKNPRQEAGSFFLQLRHPERLQMLGLRKLLSNTAEVHPPSVAAFIVASVNSLTTT